MQIAGPAEALVILASAFARWMEMWETFGFPPIRDAWTARAHGLGQACTARLERQTIDGVAESLDTDGALRLRLADGGVRRIMAGDVMFASPPPGPA